MEAIKKAISFLNLKKEKKETEKLSFSSFKFLTPYLKSHQKQIMLGTCLMIFVALLALPTPYLTKYIIDDVIIAKNIKFLSFIVIILIGVHILNLIVSYFTTFLFNTFSQEIIVNIKRDLFYRILRLPISFFDKQKTGYMISRIAEVDGLASFFSESLARILISIIEVIFFIGILFYLSWKLTIISLLVAPLFILIYKLSSRKMRYLYKEVMEKNAILTHKIHDSFSGIEVVKLFTAEEREKNKIHDHLNQLKLKKIKGDLTKSFSSELLVVSGAILGLIILWYSGIDIINGNFSIGSYVAFNAYLARLVGPTYLIANMGLTFQLAIASLNRVKSLMEMEEEEDEGRKIKLNTSIKSIEFQNVSFSFNNREVLANINLKINKGDKILITGKNGAGKTTLIKLILALYTTHKGKIFINDLDINTISPSSLRERISIVSQNCFLFGDTIKNNILYSNPNATEIEMKNATVLSGAIKFIKKLERGFDTEIGERGVRLSGGERQKISIARAFLKDSDIIIFDEATTNLDIESTKRIEQHLRDYLGDKTCIIITHRIWDTREIDKILVLNKGNFASIKTLTSAI